MNRRGFLGAILAAGIAPAIVKASSLMAVRSPAGVLTFGWEEIEIRPNDIISAADYEWKQYGPTITEIVQHTIHTRRGDLVASVRSNNALLKALTTPRPFVGGIPLYG